MIVVSVFRVLGRRDKVIAAPFKIVELIASEMC
jgi:hypothetical protein